MTKKDKKKRPPYNQQAHIRSALRRAFSRSPLVIEVLNESRREVPRYRKDGSRAKKPGVERLCALCKKWVGSTKVAVDHIVPVICTDEGFSGWDAYIERLWCDKGNLHTLCHECHQAKTNRERFDRQYLIELKELSQYEANLAVRRDEAKKWVKRFTTKRYEKFPYYPQDFKDRVASLRQRLKEKH